MKKPKATKRDTPWSTTCHCVVERFKSKNSLRKLNRHGDGGIVTRCSGVLTGTVRVYNDRILLFLWFQVYRTYMLARMHAPKINRGHTRDVLLTHVVLNEVLD